MTRYSAKFRRVARSLSRVELMRTALDDELSLADLDIQDRESGRLFLDYYSREGLELSLERYGLIDALRRRGWAEHEIETRTRDDRHTLLLDGRAEDGTTARLIDLALRRDRLKIEGLDSTFDCLTIDWLGLQNPRGRFTARRLRLPGQVAPGLGVGERVLELLYRVVSRLDLDGLVTVAEYFHNAVLYTRELRYVDPYYHGQVMALKALLFERERLGFAQAAWAMHWGCVRDVDDSCLRWRGEAMLRARHPELQAWLTREAHSEHAAEVARTLHYALARAEFDERWAASYQSLLAPPGPELEPSEEP